MDSLKLVAGRNRKWALAGLSAATISIYLIFAIIFDGRGPVTSSVTAPDRREQPRSTRSFQADQSAHERAQAPSESSAHVEPTESEMELVDLRGGVDETGDAQPGLIENKWWIARSGGTSNALPDPPVETSARAISSEIAEAMRPSEASLESRANIPSAKTEVVDLRNGVEGIADLESRSLEDKWWVARSDPPSDAHQDPQAGTPGMALLTEITEPLQPSAHIAPVETETEIADPRNEVEGAEDLEPHPGDGNSAIAETKPTSDPSPDAHQDPLAEVPGMALPAKITEPVQPSGAPSEPSTLIAPVETETEIADPRNEVTGAADLEPHPGGGNSAIAETKPTADPPSDAHQDPPAGTPGMALPTEITEPVQPSGVPSEPSTLVAPAETETEIADPRDEVDEAEDLEPHPGDGNSAIAETKPASDSLENPLLEAPTTEESAETAQATNPSDVPMKGQDRASGAEHEIKTLLAKAKRAFSSNKLTVPSGDNAYAYYRKVLARDPGNRQARSGVGRIVQKYRQLAKQRLNKGDARGAKSFASRGLKISPRDRELLAIKRQAAKAQVGTKESEPRQILERVKKWFRSGDTNTSAFMDQ